METEVYLKASKFPVHWKLHIPQSYKRNAINLESAQIFVLRKTKLEINFQVQDSQ